MDLKITHGGVSLPIETEPSQTLQSLRTAISKYLSIPPSNIRLITSENVLSPSQDSELLCNLVQPSQQLMVLATTQEIIDKIQSAKPDSLLRPFNAKTPKYVGAPSKTRSSAPKYGFGMVEAIPGFPDSHRAQEMLEQLASDRGFLSAMAKKRWNVGELREMPPDGRVGIDPECVLGYNTNKGQQIHLRLRTDDMRGFRSMYTIRQVLAHELAHNEVSEHDDKFKEVMSWVLKIAGSYDWKTGGQSVVDGPRYQPPSSAGQVGGRVRPKASHMLGGESRQSRLLQQAESKQVQEKDINAETTSIVGQTGASGSGDVDMTTGSEPELTNEDPKPETNPKSQSPRQPPSNTQATGNDQKSFPKPAVTPALEELMSLGFSSRLSQLALRENANNPQRAANWLFSDEAAPQSGIMGESESQVVSRILAALKSLSESLNQEQLVITLDALHMYMSNLVRNVGVEKYSTINDRNAAFQRRVAAFEDALGVLRAVGFRLNNGTWRYTSLNAAPVYIAKSLVQETLLQQLRAMDG